ncbi:MAG: dissimilatory sulfite reductase D family protein [Desulfovibrio sp.]|nr:dissimilatory sulfite reductase D family protein [Desulfovibrio sp.]
MDDAQARQVIIDTLKAKTNKSKFYLKDFYAFLPDMKKMAVSKLVNTMVSEGTLEYWSSGSTTMIGLKGAGKQHGTEEGE